MDHGSYFEFRQVDPTAYRDFKLPEYLTNTLGQDLNVRILGFGGGEKGKCA